MKGYEKDLYENYCKRCKSYMRCPWLCFDNTTCFEMTAFEERKGNENEDERKETV